MVLKEIELNNFRLTESERISFSDGVNLLYGKNAQGKTNVLEAIYFFARGRSFRGGKDSDIVRFFEKGYSIKIGFTRSDGEHTLEYRYYDGQRQRLCNGVKVPIKEMIGKFNAVFFCPDHLSIIKDEPSERREFLNIALSQLYGEYVSLLSDHKKLLAGKNALLKSEEPFDIELLRAYNEQFAEVSAKIYLYRREYIEKLENSVQNTIYEISGGREKANIFYKCDIPAEKSRLADVITYYRNLFFQYESRETAAKMSLCGVQRDDLLFTINDRDARQFASQGQQRSIALALKIGEGEIIASEKGESPVYLFDDVLGELDEDRKNYVLSRTSGRQMIVTACEKGDYLNLADVKMISVENGKYREETDNSLPFLNGSIATCGCIAPNGDGGIRIETQKHNKELTVFAQTLRKNMTPEEKHLWYDYLKEYPVRFLRQKVIDNYIVDFYCHEARLIIELDGSQHYEEKGILKDRIRTEKLEERNLTVIRILNRDVNKNFKGVCEYIDEFVKGSLA
ncbi:MAG: DNA replication and repair protein RecF [Clostridia bacterium]|nr:DNA replication and repair protein RecF [Clostridia bacterium]